MVKMGIVQKLLGFCSILAVISETRAACDLGKSPFSLTSWRGSISSPGLSTSMYPPDQNCQWDIAVSKGSRVRLTFLTFDLEDGFYENQQPSPSDRNCSDVVKVTDDIQVLFSNCQQEGQGRVLESSGNVMSILFYSDVSSQKSGFNATYEGVCESNVTQSGFLESPGFPDPPPEGVTCSWNITSPQTGIVYLHPDENDTRHQLPPCGSSMLGWQTVFDVPPKAGEVCRADSKVVTLSDAGVHLTYHLNNATNATWTGRLQLDFTSQSDCSDYCEHGATCVKGKGMDDVGGYQCLCAPQYTGRNCEIYVDPCDDVNCTGRGDCVTSADGVNFTCDCQPGYSGAECEIELDPCRNLTCLNGGQCRKLNVTSALCQCPAGFEPPVCEPEPSACDSAPCLHGGTCLKNGRKEFSCLCPPQITGTLCSYLQGEAHCAGEVDSTVGSGIRWTDTLAGEHDDQSCPDGITGGAKRNCIPDDRSPTGGLWRRPDLSNCISPILLELVNQSQALTQEGVAGDVLYNVTRHLDNVTSVLRSESGAGEALYPGDLLTVTEVLQRVSEGVVKAGSVEQDPPGLAQYFTSSIDNILRPSTMDIWKNARAKLVENKVTSLLTSAQQFSENLVRRQQGTRVISPRSVKADTSALLSTTSDNVDLLVATWGAKDKPWSPVFSQTKMVTPSPGNPPGFSTIRLPSQIASIATSDGSNRNITVYSGRFTSIASLLSLKESRDSRSDEVNVTHLVTSDLVSTEVLDLPHSAVSHLSSPVEITLRLTDHPKRKDLQKYCVFMNMTTKDPQWRWEQDGCFLQSQNKTHVVCFCYHLTNFAVLLDVYDNNAEIDEVNSAVLSYISYIGGSLSILACTVVIVVFEYFRLVSDRVRIHEQLAVSIIAVQILFLIGLARTAGDHSTPKWACKTVAILLHYSLTSLFCWMLVEGIHIYILLVKVFKRGSHLKKYCAIGWGVPFIVVGISVGVFFDKYGDENLCWLNHELLLVCFVPTVSLVIVINTVILVMVVRVMLRSLNSSAKVNTEHQSSVRTSLKASAVLLPLLGLTWLLGFLAVDTGEGEGEVLVYVFTYLFTVCNTFQGVLFFVFHCLLNADVHNAFERRYKQKKRGVSSLETTTRKGSEASSYHVDSSHSGKSTIKTNVSDMSVIHRKSTSSHHGFILFDNHQQQGNDPTLPSFGQARTSSTDCDINTPSVSFDTNTTVFGDVQTSDTDRILQRRHSLGQEPSGDPDQWTTAPQELRRSPSTPADSLGPSTSLQVFLSSMHDVLDNPPKRVSVHFSED